MKDLETRISQLFAEKLASCPTFCDQFREEISLPGAGLATDVDTEVSYNDVTAAHMSLKADIVASMSDLPLLIENKYRAAWSINGAGVPQPMRYRATADRIGGRAILVAPRKYLRACSDKDKFDATVSYEHLLSVLEDEAHELVGEGVDRAEVPMSYPSNTRTQWFNAFQERQRAIAPLLHMERKERHEGSYTAHFKARPSGLAHPGLPALKVHLQFQTPHVHIFVSGWARYEREIKRIGGLPHNFNFLPTKHGQLGIGVKTPAISCTRPVADQLPEIDEAIRATDRLCAWWRDNPRLLQRWHAATT